MTQHDFERMAEESGIAIEDLKKYIPDYEDNDLASLSKVLRNTRHIDDETRVKLVLEVIALAEKRHKIIKTAKEAEYLFFVLPTEHLSVNLPAKSLRRYAELTTAVLNTWLKNCTTVVELKNMHLKVGNLGSDYENFQDVVLGKWQDVFRVALDKASTAKDVVELIKHVPPNGNNRALAITKLATFYEVKD